MKAFYLKLLLFPTLALATTQVYTDTTNLVYETSDQEEAFLIRRIAEFWKDQDYQTVKVQIIDFLKKYPKSSAGDHLRGILGDLYLQENTYEKALTTYKSIRNTGILERTSLNKMQCQYELGLFEDLLTEGNKLSTEALEHRVDEYHFLMGEANFRIALENTHSDKQSLHLEKAKSHYEKVVNSSFNDPVMFALAEIYRLKNENQKASSFFMELAERHPDRREELLFHAALSQADFDKNLAVETFTKIVERNGPKQKDAALNKLILLFQQDRFEEIIHQYDGIAAMVDLEKVTTLDYIMGRSHFAREEFKESSMYLQKYINIATENSPELRNTLLMQLNCAKQLEDEDLYQDTMANLSERFPQDSELPQALFIHAMILKDKGKTEEAELKLEQILDKYPNFEDPEALHLEYSLLAYNNQNWEKSHRVLAEYLKDFSDSEHSEVALKYFLSSCIQLLKLSEENSEIAYSKELFYQDLSKVMQSESALTQSEAKECLFLRGKIAYELGSYQDSLSLLKSYLSNYPEDISLGEAHLLVALCHHKLNSSPEKFCKHAEKALSLNQELNQSASIHLELFNVYLSILEREVNSKDVEKHAAKHLFTALELDQNLNLKLENKLWLANHYYKKALDLPQIFEYDGAMPSNDQMDSFEKALSLLEEVLTNKGQSTLVTIDQENLFLEWEAFKYANLLGRCGNFDRKLTLLKELAEQQGSHKYWEWKLTKETLIELAKTYELSNKTEDALDTYQFVAKQDKDTANFLSEYANFHSIRLRFETMPSAHKTQENQEVFQMLTHLKEVQIRKSINSEPLHLEAALEYAIIRSQLAEKEERASKYLFYLGRVKEDFNNLEDPMLQTYQKGLAQQSDQKAIFDNYMKYVDAEMLRMQAFIAKEQNEPAKSVEILDQARETYKELAHSCPLFYLQMRVSKSLKATETSDIL